MNFTGEEQGNGIINFPLILCLSVIIDAAFGDPRKFPHPVKLIGRVITFWHKLLFTEKKSFFNGLAVCILTLSTMGLTVALILYISDYNFIVQVYFLYSAIAWKDLKDETRNIFQSLIENDIISARKYLSFVVGRDTENLNQNEITRSVIETISENSTDGVISVIFFAVIGHVINPYYGMNISVWLFKSASTLDSMLGYKAYGNYGKASARLDDFLNFIPARLGGIIIVMAGTLTGCNFREAFKIFMTDRLKHNSPNSAHGESAFSGVLGVRLGGGAYYGGKFIKRPFLNEKAKDPEIYDILRAFNLLDVSCSISVITAVIFSLFHAYSLRV